jgi:FlaA1/EpsC-like NDP-sugar epimerase
VATFSRSFRRIFAGDPLHTIASMALDVLVLAVAYTCALLLRFDGDVPEASTKLAARVFPLIAVAYIAANVPFGVYRTVWAYGSIGDVLNLFRPILLVTIGIFLFSLWIPERHLPLSVILIAGALAFPGMAAVKMRTRLLARAPWATVASQRLLIVGAGQTGQLLARELQANPELNYQPIGFVDNDPRRLHARIHGLRVLGTDSDLANVIDERDVEVVAIAIPRATGATIRSIVGVCQDLNVPVRMVPGVDHWALGKKGPDTLRDITPDDLLGREPVEIDYQACSASVTDQVVLVTGAAGSIGSELCRQVLIFQPRELHLLDNNESGLHDLQLELAREAGSTVLRAWIANIADEPRVDFILRTLRPNVVYHAAALKHVPLMEEHPDEAFRVNVLGTLNLARAAQRYEAGTFILISSDKAVRPTSTMGASKRIAELLMLAFARTSERTEFVSVRFGNVMGSRGSVLPIFMRQIETGGPVTVMDPRMMRYFISIPEAVSLVIQAGSFGGSGNIYMLDMGEEVNILELANRIIRLRGLRPGQDIDVVFTGSRPGEKLREELVADFEEMTATDHPKVRRLSAGFAVDEKEIFRLVDELRDTMWSDPAEIQRRMHLVAQRYSREFDESTAPEGREAVAGP